MDAKVESNTYYVIGTFFALSHYVRRACNDNKRVGNNIDMGVISVYVYSE